MRADYERFLSDLIQQLAAIREKLANTELQVKGWYLQREAKELADLRSRAETLMREIERYEQDFQDRERDSADPNAAE